MSLRRIFGLMLLFFFFEAVVAVVTTFAYPEVNVFLACVAVTGLAVGVWVVFALVTRVLTRPRAPQPAPKPVAAAIPPRPSTNEDALSQELGLLVLEANRRLAGTLVANQKGEVPSVATLPLYLVIGGEGAGKTSAMVNSGLEPQLLAGEAEREGTVIPTRLCNLWFSEGAVFADISGRLLVQESQNWERVLRVLSQASRQPRWRQILFGRRSQLNLRGMVLICDASQLTRASDPQRWAAFARTLGDRLQVAGSVLGREFPVYVLFSKCDTVQYFPEFFAHLSEPEGRRLLGATLPLLKVRNDTADIYADREGKRLTEYFNRLYMSLAEKRLVFLAREEEAAKKSNAYEFPRELKKLRSDVVQFLLDVFRPNPLHPGPRLRGFYISGQRWLARNLVATSEGTMAGFTVVPKRSDATVFFGAKSAPPSMPVRPAGPSGTIPKWMFLTDLFHGVILKDQAGNVAPRTNAREQEYRNFALAGAGALLLLLCMVWANSWRHNRELLNNVQTAVQGLRLHRAETGASGEALIDLETLREPLVPLLQYERHGAPLSYRWGLYSGNQVTPSVSALYFDRFRKLVMDPMVASLTGRFLQLQTSAPVTDDIYSLLKTYRMIASGGCKPNADFLGNTLLPIWSNAISDPPSGAEVLADRQMQFYISELLINNPYEGDIRENSNAVGQAQTYLRELNGPDKILRALVEQINHERQADTLSNYPADYGDVIVGPSTVDAAFTRDGWGVMMDAIRGHKLASAGEPCVVGGKWDQSGIPFSSENEAQVKGLYVDKFIQQWKSFMAAHHVVAYRGTADAAQKLRILADNNRSPLLGLVYMGAHNTDLTTQTEKSITETATQAVKSRFDKGVNGLFGKSGSTVSSSVTKALPSPTGPNENDVAHAFAPLKFVTDPANRDRWINANNQGYIQALEELGNSMAGMPAVIDASDPQNQQAVDRAKKAIEAAYAVHHALGGTIPNTSSGVDADLMALLKEPISNADAVFRGTPKKAPPPNPDIAIKKDVNQSARALCESIAALRTKYPFDSNSKDEASLQDISVVFAQGGTLAQFTQNQDVQKVYQHQGQTWVPNAAFQADFSKPFVDSLNGLSAFQAALYPDASGTPHFDYTVTLSGVGHLSFDLNVDGHALSYGQKKAQTSARLVWPPTTTQPTRLIVKAGQELRLEEDGTWGLFRLLQEADKQEGGLFVFSTIRLANGNQNPLQDSHGNPVQVQIRIDSGAAGAFGKGYFGKLRCENFTGMALR